VIGKKGNDLGVEKASKKKSRELLKLPWTYDEALSEFGKAHVLPDGRVLLLSHMLLPGLGDEVYPSREAVEEMNRRRLGWEREAAEQKAGRTSDPVETLLPPIDDFLRDVEVHAKKLGPRIGVADEALDLTPESLDAVDKALKKIPWAKRQVGPPPPRPLPPAV
jgi:hypothetical protein